MSIKQPTLLPHQIEGKDFLIKKKKAMLCDKVGAGKSLQAIEGLKEEGLRALLFAPKSLLKQWYKEIKKFSHLDPIVIRGSTSMRAEKYNTDKDVYLVNYEKSLTDQEHLTNLDIDCTILDEAQRIRNYRAQRSIAIKNIAKTLKPEFRWILTATPIQNRLSDLYSLLEFLDGNTIKNTVENLNTRQGGWKNYVYHDPRISGPPSRQYFLSAIKDHGTEDLFSALQDVMLRRTYSSRPPSIKTYDLEMNPDQKSMDRQFVEQMQAYIQNNMFNVTNALAMMTRRRQIANTPQLINPAYTKITPKLREIIAIAEDMVYAEEKVIFFSEFKKMTDIVSTLLTKKGIKHAYMHGEPSCDPDAEKAKFTDDPNLYILLATQTGEEGHNLQIAHHIVNIELPYNPTRIDQRIGRCDRLIGQPHTIRVINLHSENSIEERILDIIYEKEALFDDVINIHNKEIKLNRELIRQLAES